MNALFAAFLATVCTYGLTALGAAIVLVWEPTPKQMQTVMALAVGLMLSAVLDLFASAEEEAKEVYGSVAYVVPLVVGVAVATGTLVFLEKFCFAAAPEADETEHSAVGGPDSDEDMKGDMDGIQLTVPSDLTATPKASAADIRKAKLIVTALALQHIPEALACGVAFGAAAEGSKTSWSSAIALSIAIGLQDIPEGAAAALVLLRMGYSPKKAFMWGQLTGAVQPLAGVIGALAVVVVKPILPYALSFASAAMLFVIVRDMVPDCMKDGGGNTNAVTIMVGFSIMLVVGAFLAAI
eukprot:TRINITY_DN7697_c0_g1_i2.p1 TRINITY_DN7697_c0_g1~~TRINITY_DN7697_c0_g1_i2.p1  ORF type:complete len:296 (-),score=61.21 TRINITY_DN7697_c0_g1_i2:166-1053(-)